MTTTMITEPAVAEIVAEPGLRLAPMRPFIGGLFFDDDGIRSSGHGLVLHRRDMPGPVVEFVDLYDAGSFMQRAEQENTIWSAQEKPVEFLVGREDQQLELLGGRAKQDRELLVYQRHTFGTEAMSVLKSYDFQTQTTHTIALTGNANRHTEFSLVTGDHALGRFMDGDVHGIVILNLDQDRELDVFDPNQAVCRSDRDDVCPRYDHASFHPDRQLILGGRHIDDSGDQHLSYGFYWFDFINGTEELLAAFPLTNDAWEVENMYDRYVSIQDPQGNPLPGLTLEDDGSATTFPTVGFPRPQQIS